MPTFREAMRVIASPWNTYIEDVVPEVREEDGVLVIPIIEEVVVDASKAVVHYAWEKVRNTR